MKNKFFSQNADDEQLKVQRRDFIKMGLAGVIGAMVPFISTRSVLAANNNSTWKIAFRHAHTGESFSGVYRVGDKYLPEAFERLNYVLRDFRTEEVFPMDPHVIDILSIIHRKTGATVPYQALSGYRSPKTNAMLGRKTRGVASNSFHMYGQAVDIRIPEYSTRKLRNAAKSLEAGGVGYYPRSNFVHVDTGSVRTWIS
ncbi:MAG: twin-arginine translocation pathway signal sequence domain-containing protein [Zetaproteobacteria bacterium]|nr:MAG: twin-arginine translocation pathway signal sequence domain-containing protein [Zetaproteobacteria bacterium]